MFKFLKEKIQNAIGKFSQEVEEKAPETKTEETVIKVHTEVLEDENKNVLVKLKEKIIKKEEPKTSRLEELEKKLEEEKKPKDVTVTEEEAKQLEKNFTEEEKKGVFERIKQVIVTKKISEEKFNEMFSDLEIGLMENNVALEVVDKIKNDLKLEIVDKPIKRDEVENAIINSLNKSITGLLKIERPSILKEIKSKKDKPYVIAFVGVNGSGKCIAGNTLIPLPNGELRRIEEIYSQEQKDKEEVKVGQDYYINNPNLEIFSINQDIKIIPKKPYAICKLRAPEFLYFVKLENGQEIQTTPEHPFLIIEEGKPKWKEARDLDMETYIAVPKELPVNNVISPDILDLLDEEKFFVMVGDSFEGFHSYLKIKYGTIKNAHQELKIKQNYTTFSAYWRKKQMIPIKLYKLFREQTPLKFLGLQHFGSESIPYPMMSNNLSEFVGLILAEGHLAQKVVELTNKDIMIIERFKTLSKKIFNIEPKVFVDKRGLIRARLYNRAIIMLLNQAFQIPFGRKASIIEVPRLILLSNEQHIKRFLVSYIEAEAHISFENRSIEIVTSSKNMAQGLVNLLLRIGIQATVSNKETGFGTVYRVFLNGQSKIVKLKELGLYTDKSIDKLNYVNNLPSQFEITELVPECGILLKILRNESGVYQKEIARVIGTSRSLISCYESGTRMPREKLKSIADYLENEELSTIAMADVSWIKVCGIKRVKSKEEWVYDFSVEDTHNFIANNIVVHNTTSIAKMANYLQNHNLKCVLAAADTFRSAAIQQLEEHAKKLNVPIVKHDYGADPAAVAFDAIKMAKARNIDVVLIDTAGRQHSNINLVDEMKKIIRVAKPDMKLYIGEMISGNDCIEQIQQFDSAISIDGAILTKADIDEKGGTAISVSYVTKKPILFLCTGQGYDDIEEFNPDKIMQSLGF